MPRRGYRFIGPVVPEAEPGFVPPAWAAGPPEPVAAPYDDPERRQITALSCELIGVSERADGVDLEDVREALGAFQCCVTDTTEPHGGFVASRLGNTRLVLFGYPAAHEDDAEEAVRAGLELCAAVKALTRVGVASMRCRVGIATGPVIIGDRRRGDTSKALEIVGSAPGLAEQLRLSAQPDAPTIDSVTRQLIGNLFDCRNLGATGGSSGSEPVRRWQVLEESGIRSWFEALHPGSLTSLVGRDEEIDLLLRRWRRAKAGDGQIVLISGEAGLGKSRIAAELEMALQSEPHLRLRYFCSPHHQDSVLYPVIDQLGRAADFAAHDSPERRWDKLKALLVPATSTDEDVALLADLLLLPPSPRHLLPNLSPQRKKERIFAALLRQLDGRPRNQPVLVIFEDAHWADPTSRELLDLIVERVRDLPTMLILAFRPEFEAPWVGQPQVTMLALNRLDRHDRSGLIRQIAGNKALPGEILAEIADRTDGVPLFIEELTKSILESGLLGEAGDRYVQDGRSSRFAIPTTLQASLMARLDRLPAARQVAQIGAAIGREFSHSLLHAVSQVSGAALGQALSSLIGSELLFQRGSPPGAIYRFKHALVRDAAYATILQTRRQQIHAAIANILVEQFPETAESQLEVVAHHFTEAGIADRAVAYWRRAGRLAIARSAGREAVSSFEGALSLLEALPEKASALEQGLEVRLELRSALMMLGEFQHVLRRLREAELLAAQLNDDRRQGYVCAFMATALSHLGELDEAIAAGARSLEIAQRLGDAGLRIIGVNGLEQAHYYRGDYNRVIELATDNLAAIADESVRVNVTDSAPSSVADCFWLVFSLAQLGRFGEATAYAAEAIRLAEATGNPYLVTVIHYAAGTHRLIEGDWAEARWLLEHGIAAARMGDVGLLLANLVASSAWALAELDDATEALDRLREGEQLLDAQVARGFVHTWSYLMLGHGALRLDRVDEAYRLAARATESASRQPGYTAGALRLSGDIATHPERFDAERGAACYREALMLAEPCGIRPLIAHCHFGLGKLYRRTRDRDRGRYELSTARAMYDNMGMQFWLEQAAAEARCLQ